MAHAIVRATTHYKDPATLVEVSQGLGEAMAGIETSRLDEKDLMQTRGW
jgi:pyridoxal 5'-phosphate synthase pdxS subunit